MESHLKPSSCVVIDYDIGNTFSVMHALKSLGVEAKLSRDKQEIMQADRVILPGVGAFGRAAEKLRAYGLDETIHAFIQTERPFLGICVGMQLLMDQSYELGTYDGLGVIPGTVEKINCTSKKLGQLKVPLIGWYPVQQVQQDTSLLSNQPEKNTYYFVHSYEVKPLDNSAILAKAQYNNYEVVAAVHHNNIYGVQFHPERSGQSGINLIHKFLSI